MNSTTYTFAIEQHGDRFYIFRDSDKLGAKYGYDTHRKAECAITETKCWDRIAR